MLLIFEIKIADFCKFYGIIFYTQVSFTRVSSTEAAEGEEPEEVTKVVKRTLFHRSNGYPQKKVLTFNRYSEDFSFQVFYGDLDFLSPDEKRWVWLHGKGGVVYSHLKWAYKN